jgi:two-component system alkaline phosphatase synthesis response regulator PhoP/two-component system response regulator RpaA
MSSTHILVIEDDDLVSRTVERSLGDDDFKISLTDNGRDGLRLARKRSPDLVILDVIMPEMDGYEVCREMRADPSLSEMPILFLTAKIKDEDRVNGFLAGADDYLTKPFNVDELLLRVRAILRRTGAHESSPAPADEDRHYSPAARKVLQELQNQKNTPPAKYTLVAGDFVLDTQSYELHTPQRGKVRLTPIQYDLVHHMMSNPGQIFSPSRLLDEVWDYPVDTGSPDLVRVHIKNLRDRVESDPSSPSFISTVPGFGYTIDGKVSEA